MVRAGKLVVIDVVFSLRIDGFIDVVSIDVGVSNVEEVEEINAIFPLFKYKLSPVDDVLNNAEVVVMFTVSCFLGFTVSIVFISRCFGCNIFSDDIFI